MVKIKEICAASNFAGKVPQHLMGGKVEKIYPWHSEVLDLQKAPPKLTKNFNKPPKKR